MNAVVYGLALTWCFFGIAIISQTIMETFEEITSLQRQVLRQERDNQMQKVPTLVWNATVASLTLTALGVSAPEIMLALVEAVLSLDRTPGQLGSSTILGMMQTRISSCGISMFVLTAAFLQHCTVLLLVLTTDMTALHAST
jgi:hypothetical protein